MTVSTTENVTLAIVVLLTASLLLAETFASPILGITSIALLLSLFAWLFYISYK